jgi:predicted nucleotidyltransferase
MTSPPPNEGPAARRALLRRERERILDFLAQHGVREVRVFGSVARGEDIGRSDIDLLIELAEVGSSGEELLTVLGLSEELSRLLGVRVDVVTPSTLRPDVREAALAEAVPL